MNRKLPVFKNLLYLSGGKVFEILCLFFYIAIVARYLGVEEFGGYSFLWAILILLTVIPDAGINSVLVRDLTLKSNENSRYFGGAIVSRYLLCVVIFFCFLLTVHILGLFPASRGSLYFGLMWMFFRMATLSNNAVFLAYERLDLESYFTALGSSLILIFTFFVTRFTDYRITGIFASQALAEAITSVSSFIVLSAVLLKPKIEFAPSLWMHYFKNSFSVAGSRMARNVYNRIDIFFLYKFRGVGEVGIYSAPYNLIQRMSFFGLLLSRPVYPALCWFANHDKKMLSQISQKWMKILTLIGIPISVGCITFSNSIISILLGKGFEESSIVLSLLGIIFFFSFPNALLWFLSLSLGLQHVLLRYTVLSLIINTIIDLLFIPKYGYWGACAGTLAAELFFMISCMIKIKKSNPVFEFRFIDIFGKPLVAGVLMAIVAILLQKYCHISVTIFLVITTYVLVVLMTKTFTRSDIKSIREILRYRTEFQNEQINEAGELL